MIKLCHHVMRCDNAVMMESSPVKICQEIKSMCVPEVDLCECPAGIVQRMLGNAGGLVFSLVVHLISGRNVCKLSPTRTRRLVII